MNTQNSIDRRQMAGQSNMSVPSSSSLNINNTLISGNDRWQFPNVISQDYHSYWSYGQIIPPMCPAGVSLMPTPSPMAIPMQIYYQQPNGIMSQYDNNKYIQNYNMQNQRQNDMTNLVAMQLGLNCGGSQVESYNIPSSTTQDAQMQMLKNANNIIDQPYAQSYNMKVPKTFKTANEEIISLKEQLDQQNDEFDRMSEYDTPDVPVISCNQLNPDQLGELTRMAMKGCELAERLAHTHRNRPCFKKIDSLCARMKQDLIRPDGVLANINSQGIAWAVKDFIFVFTRIINAWIIIKGYVYNTPDGLNRVKTALNPEFIESFIKWQDATMIFVDNIIKSFLSLDQLVQNHRTTFQKMDIIINKSNSSSTGKSIKDDIDLSKSPFFKTIEDPYDYFLETYSDTEQHIKKNSNNDTHGNYFSTVVKNSEESQRKALENGTYFKTGVYNPLKRDINATVFKDLENDNFLQSKNNFSLSNNKFGKKDISNNTTNINNNNINSNNNTNINNNNNNNSINNNTTNINNNNSNNNTNINTNNKNNNTININNNSNNNTTNNNNINSNTNNNNNNNINNINSNTNNNNNNINSNNNNNNNNNNINSNSNHNNNNNNNSSNNNNNTNNNNINNNNNNNNINNTVNNFDNQNLDKENRQNGNLLSDFNISPTHGEGDGTTSTSNPYLSIKCDLFENDNLMSGEQGTKKLFDNGLLSETVLMKYFEPDIIEKIKYLLQKICNLNEAKYFFSVNFTKNYFPDFLKVVPNYIDIRSIILKMQIGGYKNIFEIVHDLRQIVISVNIYLQKKPQNFLLKSILIFDKELETVLSENIFEKFDFVNIRASCLNNTNNYNLNNI